MIVGVELIFSSPAILSVAEIFSCSRSGRDEAEGTKQEGTKSFNKAVNMQLEEDATKRKRSTLNGKREQVMNFAVILQWNGNTRKCIPSKETLGSAIR